MIAALLLAGVMGAQASDLEVLSRAAAEILAVQDAARAWGCQPLSVPGRVIDVRGRPVEGARVSVRRWAWESTVLASTRAGPDGRYRLPGPLPDNVWIEANAPGFLAGSHGGLARCMGGKRLVLVRDFDALAAELPRVSALEERLGLAMELCLQGLPSGEELLVAFPLVGELQPELEWIALNPGVGPSTMAQARALLRLWGDPADGRLWEEKSIASDLSRLIGLTRPDLALLLGEVRQVSVEGGDAQRGWGWDEGPVLVLAKGGERMLFSFWVWDGWLEGDEVRVVVEQHAGSWMVVQATFGDSISPSLDGY